MLKRYFSELLLGFTIIFAQNCLAAELLENDTKIMLFKSVTNKIFKEYLSHDLNQQYVVIIHTDFNLSYEKRDRLLKDLYEKILKDYQEVFAIAYMNFTKPLNLGFIIVDKDFCPEIKSEINKLSIPKINLSNSDDIYNFITSIGENNTSIFVPEAESDILHPINWAASCS